MKKVLNKRKDSEDDPEPVDTVGDRQLVGLDSLDPEKDDSEVADAESSEPPADSPGDEALLEQEEAYEGISSERVPSEKAKKEDHAG
jgi:hypothetical protein